MITPANLVPKLNNIVSELTIIQSKFQNQLENPQPEQSEINNIQDEFIEIIAPLPEIIRHVAKNKPDPAIIGTKLKDSFTLQTQILRQLTELKKRQNKQAKGLNK